MAHPSILPILGLAALLAAAAPAAAAAPDAASAQLDNRRPEPARAGPRSGGGRGGGAKGSKSGGSKGSKSGSSGSKPASKPPSKPSPSQPATATPPSSAPAAPPAAALPVARPPVQAAPGVRPGPSPSSRPAPLMNGSLRGSPATDGRPVSSVPGTGAPSATQAAAGRTPPLRAGPRPSRAGSTLAGRPALDQPASARPGRQAMLALGPDGHRAPLASIDSAGKRAALADAHGPPIAAARAADGPRAANLRPYQSKDPRIAHPAPNHLRQHPEAQHPPPRYGAYGGWYAQWWVHPYYRNWHVSSCVVGFGYPVYPWRPIWVPPARAGWLWYPGWWAYGIWWPGYWGPTTTTVVVYDRSYVYVPGYWQSDLYVDGYYRVQERDDGDWIWVEGVYLDDGTFIPGHWVPAAAGPEGYDWEPGFFDGESWVGGFWRPEFRDGFVWISAWFDAEGVYHAGYWEPTVDKPGHVWIPGWFDGQAWVEGSWVTEAAFREANPDSWTPAPGQQDGWKAPPAWKEGGADSPPLAIPVVPEARLPGAPADVGD